MISAANGNSLYRSRGPTTRRSSMDSSKPVDCLPKQLPHISRDRREAGIVHSLHRSDRINGGDLYETFADLLQYDVAWQHCADAAFLLQGLVGESRVAGAEDDVRSKFDIQLLLQRRRDVDGGEDTEPLGSQRRRDVIDRLVHWHRDRLAEVVAHREF